MNPQQTTFSQRSFLLKIYVASIAVVAFYLVLCPLLSPSITKVALVVILGAAFLIGYFVTLRSKDFIRSSHFYIVVCYLVLLTNALISGGVGAPGMIWLLLCPLIAFITLSTHFARVWLAIIVATVSLLYAFDNRLFIEQVRDDKVWYLVSYILFFPMVYSIMKIFRREVSKKNVELNVLNQKLNDEREMLQKTQEEILFQSRLIRETETRAIERSSKLSFYLDQLTEVRRMEEVHSGNLEYAVRTILQFLQKSMMLKNVALWYAGGPAKPHQLFRYMGDVSDVPLLCREDFADAFDMLQTGVIINTCDTSREARQLKSLFRLSAGNESIVNCPYFLDGKFAGFITCSAVDKTWGAEDIIFIRAMSDTISLAFKSHHRIRQQLEITQINESLEQKVLERTIQLKMRNQQLTDFAFTNAHHIRGPICRLLGLQNLLNATDDCHEVLMIADYMTLSINELDAITKKTSEELNAIVDC